MDDPPSPSPPLSPASYYTITPSDYSLLLQFPSNYHFLYILSVKKKKKYDNGINILNDETRARIPERGRGVSPILCTPGTLYWDTMVDAYGPGR
jgi:hypothetical protein